MPVSDIHIHRAANMIMKQHGDGAIAHARSRIADLSAAGDAEGVAVWSQIVVAIEALGTPSSDRLSKAFPKAAIRVTAFWRALTCATADEQKPLRLRPAAHRARRRRRPPKSQTATGRRESDSADEVAPVRPSRAKHWQN